MSAPGAAVNIRDQVVIMEFVQGDKDECTIVRRLRETDGEQSAEALPWMDLGDLQATELDFEWMFGVYPTPEGLMPTMIVSGLETAIGHLGGVAGTLIARIEDDRIHLCRNDPTMSTAQSTIITCDDIGAEHALWVAAARERGKCTLHLVKQLPRTRMEVNAVTATDGLLIDARIDSGWESLDTVAALLGHRSRPDTLDSAAGPTSAVPPKSSSLFRRLLGK